MCYFHPEIWGKMNPFWRTYFSIGLKFETTKYFWNVHREIWRKWNPTLTCEYFSEWQQNHHKPGPIWLIVLMVQKSWKTTWSGAKTRAVHGINYQLLVSLPDFWTINTMNKRYVLDKEGHFCWGDAVNLVFGSRSQKKCLPSQRSDSNQGASEGWVNLYRRCAWIVYFQK